MAEEKPKEIAKEKTPEPTPVKSKKKSKKNANKKKVKAHDKREHLNIVFIGHVDAGKILYFSRLRLHIILVFFFLKGFCEGF